MQCQRVGTFSTVSVQFDGKSEQSSCRNKFGPHAIRIWRLLLLNGQMEQKQVAELAMVPKEEAREALYAMLQAG